MPPECPGPAGHWRRIPRRGFKAGNGRINCPAAAGAGGGPGEALFPELRPPRLTGADHTPGPIPLAGCAPARLPLVAYPIGHSA